MNLVIKKQDQQNIAYPFSDPRSLSGIITTFFDGNTRVAIGYVIQNHYIPENDGKSFIGFYECCSKEVRDYILVNHSTKDTHIFNYY